VILFYNILFFVVKKKKKKKKKNKKKKIKRKNKKKKKMDDKKTTATNPQDDVVAFQALLTHFRSGLPERMFMCLNIISQNNLFNFTEQLINGQAYFSSNYDLGKKKPEDKKWYEPHILYNSAASSISRFGGIPSIMFADQKLFIIQTEKMGFVEAVLGEVLIKAIAAKGFAPFPIEQRENDKLQTLKKQIVEGVNKIPNNTDKINEDLPKIDTFMTNLKDRIANKDISIEKFENILSQSLKFRLAELSASYPNIGFFFPDINYIHLAIDYFSSNEEIEIEIRKKYNIMFNANSIAIPRTNLSKEISLVDMGHSVIKDLSYKTIEKVAKPLYIHHVLSPENIINNPVLISNESELPLIDEQYIQPVFDISILGQSDIKLNLVGKYISILYCDVNSPGHIPSIILPNMRFFCDMVSIRNVDVAIMNFIPSDKINDPLGINDILKFKKANTQDKEKLSKQIHLSKYSKSPTFILHLNNFSLFLSLYNKN
jgi:hypothetical protein